MRFWTEVHTLPANGDPTHTPTFRESLHVCEPSLVCFLSFMRFCHNSNNRLFRWCGICKLRASPVSQDVWSPILFCLYCNMI